MNLVFLTSESPHHLYLINEIHKVHPVKKVFFQTRQEAARQWSSRFRRLLRISRLRFELRAILRRLLFAREDRLRREYESRMFFGGREPVLDPAIPKERFFSFNAPEAVEAVRKEAPDLVVVFGTEILRGEILGVARKQILNIHRDILPDYRGGGMPFWVFYNDDFETLGTTLHVCAEKLDAGAIVGQKRYKLVRDDRVYMLRYKTTLLSVDILKEVIARYIDGTVRYTPQPKTRLWTSGKLTIVKELIARRNFNRYVSGL